MSSEMEQHGLIDRREAVRRVSALLGGIAFVGGSGLLTACERERPGDRAAAAAGGKAGDFSAEDIAFLDEVADTILPETKTPGAKAAKVGAFMALMVTDSYDKDQQKIFRDGMEKIDEASEKASGAKFMKATPQARLALIESLDREQKQQSDARMAAALAAADRGRTTKPPEAKPRQSASKQDTATPPEGKKGDAYLPDQRQENAVGTDAGTAAPAITADAPAHYFRMMKELTLLGYFTSEIGYTQAMRYVESPGRFDPCVPYKAGEKAWAAHA
jgi:hypothetical protein